MSKEFNQGKIKPLIKIIAQILEQDPYLHKDYDKLIAKVEAEVPELKDKTKCPNCDASMTQYVYNLNVLGTALVINMAKAVREATRAGKSFTEANIVHIPTLPTSDAIRHKTTHCAKLGLIAKYIKDGRQIKGMWVITKRGFAALKGEEIPNGIIVWRGRTIERPDNMTTFAKVRARHERKVGENNNYCAEVMDYNPNDWIGFAGFHDGRLF